MMGDKGVDGMPGDPGPQGMKVTDIWLFISYCHHSCSLVV